MDPPAVPSSTYYAPAAVVASTPPRTQSFSQHSDDSQTAAEFIDSQLQLEADALEALPYKFETCTNTLGKLRQVLFSCITCNPPPSDPNEPYSAAGVCYSCSIQCHGEHTLVELFNKRDFVCDCGTTRLPPTSHCALRMNPKTNTKGRVHSEEAAPDNKYNHNFRNRFCGCDCDYDAYKEKGTMFQCLGLGTADAGGCGEDWWHPGCIVGLGPNWHEHSSPKETPMRPRGQDPLASIAEVVEAAVDESSAETKTEVSHGITSSPKEASPEAPEDDEDPPLPPGFPGEDDFEAFICYKCVDANPWIKRYAGTPGFLAPVFRRSAAPSPETALVGKIDAAVKSTLPNTKKRKAEDNEGSDSCGPTKRQKDANGELLPADAEVLPGKAALYTAASDIKTCKITSFPSAPIGQMSLFLKEDFRAHLCRCSDCFPLLKAHAQLLEEEEIYEPSISESENEAPGSTIGSGSIYDRGESALKNVDRVKAIEGVMAYNHLKDKLKPFFQQFAESGKAISAEDIKAHFAKMRGDEEAIKEAGEGARNSEDNRREQSEH